MKKNSSPLLILIAVVFTCSNLYAQATDEKQSATKTLVEGKRYEFVAQSMQPMSGRLRQLTTYYFVRVTPDTLISDLPYVGRAFSPSYDPSAAGVNFTSTSYTYTITDRKKGGWEIVLKPKDYTDVQQLQLTVYANGTAYLHVTSNNKQPISYHGVLEPVKEKKKS